MENPIKIYHNKVDRLQIARYYLESELPNILQADNEQVHLLINTSVLRLSDKQVWRLLEALSHTYRINGVFALISNAGYDWQEVELPFDAITLIGTRPHVNKIVYSEEVQRNPDRFAKYLQTYFAEHSQYTDDPLELNEFRPREQPHVHDILIVRQDKEGKVKIVDGTHRLVVRSMAGETSFRCYYAVPNGKLALRRRGDGIFAALRDAYLTMPDHRGAILEVTKALAKDSLDGRDAVEDYWITHVQAAEDKRIGEILLTGIVESDKPTD